VIIIVEEQHKIDETYEFASPNYNSKVKYNTL